MHDDAVYRCKASPGLANSVSPWRLQCCVVWTVHDHGYAALNNVIPIMTSHEDMHSCGVDVSKRQADSKAGEEHSQEYSIAYGLYYTSHSTYTMTHELLHRGCHTKESMLKRRSMLPGRHLRVGGTAGRGLVGLNPVESGRLLGGPPE